MSRSAFGYLALLAFGLAAPFFIYPVLVMKILCFALFACAFNLLLGYTGLLSFGHAAFFGTAAYVAGHVIKVWGFPTELGLLAGTASAALLGWVRQPGDPPPGHLFRHGNPGAGADDVLPVPAGAFHRGEDGLQGVPRGTLLGVVDLSRDLNLYYFVLAIFAFAFVDLSRHPLAFRTDSQGDSGK